MRVLLSTIGSRGDVQPLVALASELRALGQEVRLCVPPDFRDWIESLGIPVISIGPRCARRGSPAHRQPLLRPNNGVRWPKVPSPRNLRRSWRQPQAAT
jgi:UDP:flavonoid glycosyltransferase YjiC (YdhE family)